MANKTVNKLILGNLRINATMIKQLKLIQIKDINPREEIMKTKNGKIYTY